VIVLTKRQEQIVERLTRGETQKELAAQLFISKYTVRQHLHRALVKNHCRTTAMLVAAWVQQESTQQLLAGIFEVGSEATGVMARREAARREGTQ
jgi:DNA-binding CsgD family transcriptional regulator